MVRPLYIFIGSNVSAAAKNAGTNRFDDDTSRV
jgi:hypothetical protein